MSSVLSRCAAVVALVSGGLAIFASRTTGVVSERLFQFAVSLVLALIVAFSLWAAWNYLHSYAEWIEKKFLLKFGIDRRYLRLIAIILVLAAVPIELYVRHLIIDQPPAARVIHVDASTSPEVMLKQISDGIAGSIDQPAWVGGDRPLTPTIKFDLKSAPDTGAE